MRRFFTLCMVLSICLMGVALLDAKPAQAQGGGTYVVQPGDTLFTIADKFGVSLSELATINGIYDVNRVFVGQVLVIPTPINPPAAPPVRPAPAPQPAPSLPVYPPGTTVTVVTNYQGYVVRHGDTLSRIAQRFRTTIDLIMAANGIGNPNFVFVGQHLIIPRITTNVRPQPRPQTPRARGNVYVVQPGDNLFGIAARFRRNIYDIARANGLLNLNHIFTGQALVIP
jgi:peptidoglycan-N-acetylglucosamine deacetylase